MNSCLTYHTRSDRAEERWLGVDISTAACLGCAHSGWDAQAAHLSSRHQMVAVDLRRHGASPGTAPECPIERSGADVAENHAGALFASRVLVGHSMGCRVVTEGALQAPAQTAGVVLIDGSQFVTAMDVALVSTHRPDKAP